MSPSPLWGEGRGEVLPVLMYHSISDRDERHLRDYFKVCTPPARFREQMQTLKENGFTGVDLQTGLAWLNRRNEGAPASGPASTRNGDSPSAKGETDLGGELGSRRREEADPLQPEETGATQPSGRGEVDESASRLSPLAFSQLRPVVITFDDGFQDFFTEAVPVMQEHRFTATMYLPTAYITERRSRFKEIPCMTWDEVREARCAGMAFGSHTVNHPKLYGLPWAEIEMELRDSRREMEDELGEAVLDFAYPYAFPEVDRAFCDRFRTATEAAGYSTCATTIVGRLSPAGDLYTLPRLPMNGADDGKLLSAKLAGAYDWLAGAQRALKVIKQSGSYFPASGGR